MKKAFELLQNLLTRNKFYREHGITLDELREHLDENGFADVKIWIMLFQAQREWGAVNLNLNKFPSQVLFVWDNKMLEIKPLSESRINLKPTPEQRNEMGSTEMEEWCNGEGKDFIAYFLKKKGV